MGIVPLPFDGADTSTWARGQGGTHRGSRSRERGAKESGDPIPAPGSRSQGSEGEGQRRQKKKLLLWTINYQFLK